MPTTAGAEVREAAASLIVARNLTKTYRVDAHTIAALTDVSLDIASGDFVAIMGPSGSGKSTLMNLLGTLDRPSSGTLAIDGTEVTALDEDALPRLRNSMIGFVFQQFNLLPRTPAIEQVMLPLLYRRTAPDKAAAIARERLAEVGLLDRINHLPSQLSGGQQQRVAIARALAVTPKLILADEPTGALDSNTSSEIMELLTTLNRRGVTIIVVTHEADVAAYARRRIVFRDGRILSDEGISSSAVSTSSHGATRHALN